MSNAYIKYPAMLDGYVNLWYTIKRLKTAFIYRKEQIMELRVLRYFLAVAREETISAAAEYLHLSQPSLSRQLMDLEKELGKLLFVRGNRKIALTEDGELLRRRATEIITLVEKTESEIQDSNEPISGNIYIGGDETNATRFIAKAAKSLQKAHPYIQYHMYSGTSDDVKERLDKGLLDFGVLVGPFDHTKYDSIKLPTRDRLGVLMRKDSPLAKQEFVKPEDLYNLPLIISRKSMALENQLEWLGKSTDELNVVGTYNLIYNASLLVEEGLGYAIGLEKPLYSQSEGLLCFRPLSPVQEITMDLVWKKYQVFSKTSEKFLQQVQSTIEEFSL